jgi:extracellular elastinolytic metalloproteinase
MGEGWGDFFATMIRMHSANDTEFAMGEWASARQGGIRNFKYSTSLAINTDSYKTLDQPGYWGVHAIGEVWAEMLFELAELLIAQHGFHSGLFPPAPNATDSTGFYTTKSKSGIKVPKHGNTLVLQLVVDGLKLQPCRPSFQDARDAILDADVVLTGGENSCLIWKAFSKRGLGPNAVVVGSTPWGGGVRTEDHSLPKACLV